jgi:hypothetical protein
MKVKVDSLQSPEIRLNMRKLMTPPKHIATMLRKLTYIYDRELDESEDDLGKDYLEYLDEAEDFYSSDLFEWESSWKTRGT